ncbi:amidohydrolase family protein [Actinomadura opuntiae]|uniref:amidohydrolase family protein n=1 Tax=Actinomadura sp. OS1-43 TaxID=604315 RepID=UPI00255A7F7D|nr:amidohydrolase family protein [Actinomadura sp. OS1-43]MDL4821787.1 amidohydrolase family protein [Actinomadura sp. OS1-43]
MARDRIDIHAHYLGGTVAALFDSGFTLAGGYKISPSWTAEAALAFMDRHEISTQLLSAPWPFAGTDDDPAFAKRFCRNVNREYAELIAAHPGRFGAFAAVPLDDPDTMLAEIAYALDELELDGVLLNSNSLGHYFGQPFYEPVLADLDRRKVPVFLHPTDCPHVDVLGFGRPSSVSEYPFDTARNIVNAIYTGVFQRYPDLTLILAHCGGVLPTLGWRIAEHTTMGMGPTDAGIDPGHVTGVLRGLYYETALAAAAHSLLPALQVTGPEHILFGTDWPAAPEATVERNIDNLLAFEGLSTAQLTDVDRGNAGRLFNRFA